MVLSWAGTNYWRQQFSLSKAHSLFKTFYQRTFILTLYFNIWMFQVERLHRFVIRVNIFSILNHPCSFMVYYLFFLVNCYLRISFNNFVPCQKNLKIMWLSSIQSSFYFFFFYRSLRGENLSESSPEEHRTKRINSVMRIQMFNTCTGIAEVMGSNPAQSLNFFQVSVLVVILSDTTQQTSNKIYIL